MRSVLAAVTAAVMCAAGWQMARAEEFFPPTPLGDRMGWCVIEKVLYITGEGEMPCPIPPGESVPEEGRVSPWNQEDLTIRTVKVSEGVTSLMDYSFTDRWDPGRIYLPLSLQRIGRVALCMTELFDIYYAGTEEMWDRIEGSKYVSCLNGEYTNIHFMGHESISDGAPNEYGVIPLNNPYVYAVPLQEQELYAQPSLSAPSETMVGRPVMRCIGYYYDQQGQKWWYVADDRTGEPTGWHIDRPGELLIELRPKNGQDEGMRVLPGN